MRLIKYSKWKWTFERQLHRGYNNKILKFLVYYLFIYLFVYGYATFFARDVPSNKTCRSRFLENMATNVGKCNTITVKITATANAGLIINIIEDENQDVIWNHAYSPWKAKQFFSFDILLHDVIGHARRDEICKATALSVVSIILSHVRMNADRFLCEAVTLRWNQQFCYHANTECNKNSPRAIKADHCVPHDPMGSKMLAWPIFNLLLSRMTRIPKNRRDLFSVRQQILMKQYCTLISHRKNISHMWKSFCTWICHVSNLVLL